MKKLFFCVSLALAAVAVAEETTTVAKDTPKRRVLTEAQKESIRRGRYRKTGGLVKVPGMQKGTIGFFVLKDKRIPDAKVSELRLVLEKSTRIDIRRIDVETFSLKDASTQLRAHGLNAGVFVTWSEEIDAPLLCAPEQHWAMVNAHPLKADAKDESVYADRVLKETARAYAYVCGAAGSSNGEGLMNVTSVAELDKVEAELPFDVLNRLVDYMKAIGVTPFAETTYIKAVQQGWAPAPTNDIQKAIWDKVHEIPAKPLKITYDKQKQKPVTK